MLDLKRKRNNGGFSIDSNNLYTKYSLDLYNYPTNQQLPQLFDKRCMVCMRGSGTGSVDAGISRPYLLHGYKNKSLTICLNQINIKNSKVTNANLDNIQQNNNCGDNNKKDINKIPRDKS